ncbi:hypothetical protein PLICRDRAFT_100731 [Plicaturopsis crispa FD-325 SS-3]|nr:hypothetical protein PLICRDRAFT_100731 [Plicaturopsis crispa FD-325 SS-3]
MVAGSSFDDAVQVVDEPLVNKGKGREIPPTLPPLTFEPSALYGKEGWPSPGLMTPTPGPSSYGSGSLSDPEISSPQTSQSSGAASNAEDRAHTPVINRLPSRRRSLSNLSVKSSRSLAARSVSNIREKLGSPKPGNLARKLLFRKRPDSPEPLSPITSDVSAVPAGTTPDARHSGWEAGIYSPSAIPFSSLNLEIDLASKQVLQYSPRPYNTCLPKGRSYSYPLSGSALDYIPTAPETDVFGPILIPRNSFDEMLPRELQLHVLMSLIGLHEEEHRRTVREGKWTATKATSRKNKWVGEARGVRELLKLSRVSKAWQSLVYDGQIWANVDLKAFPLLPPSVVFRLTESAGAFVKGIDLTGHTRLETSTLVDMTDALCLSPADLQPSTRLTSINLQGCSAISTRGLHHLLTRSPSLQRLCVKGLRAVRNTTCDIISVHCPQLTSLDMSRCINVTGDGIRSWLAAAMYRGDRLPLKELRLSGLKNFNDDVMATIGQATPDLEVLDLSYIRSLHNSALDAFVSCGEGEGVESVLLTAREAGRDPADSTRYRRRVTRLRHLSLSSCILLTDIACSNLAHAVPNLEFLELASVGAGLGDDGLIHLLGTTPNIRKLDLEDAREITDDVLEALTPNLDEEVHPHSRIKGPPPPQTGHALEHLIVSDASNLTDDAFIDLIRGCTRLRVLEVDSTRMSGQVLMDFVRTARKRKMINPRIVTIDCRGIGENLVKELSPSTRPRLGWRAYDGKKLAYLDGRDKEEYLLKIGQDECDETRVVLKSFYSWQTVDAVSAAREKRRKSNSRRVTNDSTDSVSGGEDLRVSDRARWWSPGARRATSGGNTPTHGLNADGNRDSCTIM